MPGPEVESMATVVMLFEGLLDVTWNNLWSFLSSERRNFWIRSKQPTDAIKFGYAAIKFVSGLDTRVMIDSVVKAEATLSSSPEFA